MRKRRRPPEPPALADGYYWFRNFIHLRQGGYHYEWRIARVFQGKTQPLGMLPLEPDCRYLQHALWHGPIKPPPLDSPPSTALAVEQAGSRRGRNSRRAASSAGEPTPGTQAIAVAGAVVNSLVNVAGVVVAYYDAHPQDRADLVERIAVLLERAFGSRSLAEEL